MDFNEEHVIEDSNNKENKKGNKHYDIHKSIYIYNLDSFLIESGLLLNNYIRNNHLYKCLSRKHKIIQTKSILDIAAYSYCLTRTNNIVTILSLDFNNTNVIYLIESVLNMIIPRNVLDEIKEIYLKILENYEQNPGLFLYTDFELNHILLDVLFKTVLSDKIYKNKILITGHYLMIFNSNLKKENFLIKKLEECFNKYSVELKKIRSTNLFKNDLLFFNNIVVENYSGVIKNESIEFIKTQLKKKIYQEISISSASEILLLKHINIQEFNIIKNKITQNQIEYLQKIKKYFDFNNGPLYR